MKRLVQCQLHLANDPSKQPDWDGAACPPKKHCNCIPSLSKYSFKSTTNTLICDDKFNTVLNSLRERISTNRSTKRALEF